MKKYLKRSVPTGLLMLSLVFAGQAWAKPAAPETKKEKSESDDSAGGMDWIIGVVPDLNGNVNLDSGLSFDYGYGLNAGVTFTRTARGESVDCEADEYSTPSSECRELNVIKDTIGRLQALGYRYNIGESFYLLPRINGQYYYQERQTNLVDVPDKRYKTEDGLLESYQLNIELESEAKFGWGAFRFGGSISPIGSSKESTRGYDSGIAIQDPDKTEGNPNNIIYTGNLGDFTANNSTSVLYFDAGFKFTVYDLLGGADMLLGFKYGYIDYSATADKTIIKNGEQTTEETKFEFQKTEMGFSLGSELPFLGLAGAKPFASLDYTMAKYGAPGNQVTDNVFGIGLTVKR